jgi:hypothetical protein
VFTSANVLRSYSMEQLVGLGVSWVWMGLEGKESQYGKLAGADTKALVGELQAHGIRVLGSSIIGLEEHGPENIDEAIDHAVAHDTEFHQFMLYTPVPGTRLWAELLEKGTLLDPLCLDVADSHGQLRFNYRHPRITHGEESEYLLRAFERDFEVNGPSVARVIGTTLRGYLRYRRHADRRIRARFAFDARGLITHQAGAVWACRKWFRDQPSLRQKMDELLRELYEAFGWRARLLAPLVGRYVFRCLRREDRRLRAGWTYEPPTICERARVAV